MHDIGDYTGTPSGIQGGGYGLYIHTFDSRYANNEIYNLSGYGIHHYSGALSANGGNGNVFLNNRIYNTGRTGLLMASAGRNNIAAYNVITNTGFNAFRFEYGLHVGCYGPGETAGNIVAHNTLVGNHQGLGVECASHTVVRNNILFRNGGGDAILDAGTGTSLDHNLLGIDPLFVQATSGDFHLRAGSPAIDQGVVIPGVTYGMVGPPDLGAYEFGGQTGPGSPSGSTPPRRLPAPTNLRLGQR